MVGITVIYNFDLNIFVPYAFDYIVLSKCGAVDWLWKFDGVFMQKGVPIILHK